MCRSAEIPGVFSHVLFFVILFSFFFHISSSSVCLCLGNSRPSHSGFYSTKEYQLLLNPRAASLC